MSTPDRIINAELPEKGRPKRFEQSWAQQLAEDMFEVADDGIG